jgi:hypothetical protein
MGDYLRVTDMAHVPHEFFSLYENQPAIVDQTDLETARSA